MNKKRYSAMLVMSLILTAGIAVAATMPTGDATNGKAIFDAKCGTLSCHAAGSEHPISSLSKLAATDINSTVRNGVNGTSMRAFAVTELSDSNLNDVIAYIQSATPTSTMYANASTPATTTTTNVSTNATQPTPTIVATEAVTEAPTEIQPTIVQPTEAVTEVQTPIPTPTPKSPGFEVVIGIIGIVSIYLMRKQKR